jgi:phage antirepressor YoqD-like protein
MYATDELIANPDLAIAAFTALKEEREKNKRLMAAVAVGQQQIAEMKPKATYYDVVLKCKDAVNISVIAKDYGWSGIRMNEYLHEKGIQFKQGDIWLLYQKYAPNGYTKTNTHVYEDNKGIKHTKVHTKWTQKGRLFIYEQLKADGIYPQIEMEV